MAVFTGNGAAATPSFTFSSDTDLGIFRGGTDILSFATAGAEVGKFDATGGFTISGLTSIDIVSTDANGLLIANPIPHVKTDVTGVTGADTVTNVISLTQAEYDAITTPDAATLYIVVG